jgi:uncharacterized protein YgiM (DUF1202 family)
MRNGRYRSGKFRVLLTAWLGMTLLLVSGIGGAQQAFAAAVTVGETATVSNTDGDPIRVRRDAGTQYSQIGTVYEGQSVTVLAGPRTDRSGDAWYRIQRNSLTGWVHSDFLSGNSPSAQRASTTKLTGYARVANTDGDPLRMRATPGTRGTVLTFLSPDTVVAVKHGPVTDDAGIAWYQITINGRTGWVMAQYLAQADAPTQTQRAPSEPQSAPRQSGNLTTLEQYRVWMEEARRTHPYPQSLDKMWAVMWCESKGQANAAGDGGTSLGIFQYKRGTWGGSWNPYRNQSIWDPRAQIFATAKAWSIGMQSHWTCYYKTPGR